MNIDSILCHYNKSWLKIEIDLYLLFCQSMHVFLSVCIVLWSYFYIQSITNSQHTFFYETFHMIIISFS